MCPPALLLSISWEMNLYEISSLQKIVWEFLTSILISYLTGDVCCFVSCSRTLESRSYAYIGGIRIFFILGFAVTCARTAAGGTGPRPPQIYLSLLLGDISIGPKEGRLPRSSLLGFHIGPEEGRLLRGFPLVSRLALRRAGCPGVPSWGSVVSMSPIAS